MGRPDTNLDRDAVRAIRRRVRVNSGRSDGLCGKVSEALEEELGWAYRWGHIRLLDGEFCWIHCWNELSDGTIMDATADQFEERWLGDVVVLRPDDPLHGNYRAAPRPHLFWTVCCEGIRMLRARVGIPNGEFDEAERLLATVSTTDLSWSQLGAAAVAAHSGWQAPPQVALEAGVELRKAEAAGRQLTSRELEFALDALARDRRRASRGEWISPESRTSSRLETWPRSSGT